MDSEYKYTSKATARIDKDVYNAVQANFQHGQQTQFMRMVFDSLKTLIDKKQFNTVVDYMYKGKSLTLPKVEK